VEGAAVVGAAAVGPAVPVVFTPATLELGAGVVTVLMIVLPTPFAAEVVVPASEVAGPLVITWRRASRSKGEAEDGPATTAKKARTARRRAANERILSSFRVLEVKRNVAGDGPGASE
jgi:hypothetical protein